MKKLTAIVALLMLVAAGCASPAATPTPMATPTSIPPTATPLPLSGLGRIAFARGGDVFLFDTSTGRETKIVERQNKENLQTQGAEWSPKGRVLAYADRASGIPEDGFPQLFLYDTDAGTSRQLKSVGAVTIPIWSPNGKYIAVDFGTGAAGRRLTLVDVERDKELGAFRYGSMLPAWAPDGTQLAMMRSKDIGLPIEGGGGSSLVVVTIYDDVAKETLFLEGSREYIYGPLRWLDDGSLVFYRDKILDYEALKQSWDPSAFSRTYWLYQTGTGSVQLPEGDSRIAKAKADPKEAIRALLPKAIVGGLGPNVTFSADGEWVAFNGGHHPDYSIYAMRSDGSGGVLRLTAGFAPSWEPK